jgi:hypothetical protein
MNSVQNFSQKTSGGKNHLRLLSYRKYKQGMNSCTLCNVVEDMIATLASVSPVMILLVQQKASVSPVMILLVQQKASVSPVMILLVQRKAETIMAGSATTSFSWKFPQIWFRCSAKEPKVHERLNFFHIIVITNPKWREHLEHISLDWRIIWKRVLKIGWECMDWIHLTGSREHGNEQ